MPRSDCAVGNYGREGCTVYLGQEGPFNPGKCSRQSLELFLRNVDPKLLPIDGPALSVHPTPRADAIFRLTIPEPTPRNVVQDFAAIVG